MPPNYPGDVLRIERYADAVEILRDTDFGVEPLGREAPLREGTLIKIDGRDHVRRRKAGNRLVRKEWHENYRRNVLTPTVLRRLRDLVPAAGPDGLVHIDLVHFSRALFVDMAAAVTGVDLDGSDEQLELLTGLIEPMHSGSIVKWFADHERVMREALEAMETFRRTFYEPSMRRHVEIAEAVERGHADKSDLPLDLMTLIATGAEPAWADDDALALRTVIFYLGGASNTHVRPLGFAIDELTTWFRRRPADRALLRDPQFLGGAINETLRLYGNTPAVFRHSSRDKTLPSGRTVAAGQYVAIDTRLTGRDVDAFGPDADVFDPHRVVPEGINPFGMAFGGGRHMCQGLPIVLGSEGINGTLLHVVQKLFDADIAPDPAREPVKVPERDTYEVYPVTLDATAIAGLT
ncbi:MAG TPA: cytochrome P450 [Amycolatopsis sp.]|nr:cytochrome P450 [Amycolatopsis sp.]